MPLTCVLVPLFLPQIHRFRFLAPEVLDVVVKTAFPLLFEWQFPHLPLAPGILLPSLLPMLPMDFSRDLLRFLFLRFSFFQNLSFQLNFSVKSWTDFFDCIHLFILTLFDHQWFLKPDFWFLCLAFELLPHLDSVTEGVWTWRQVGLLKFLVSFLVRCLLGWISLGLIWKSS